MLFTAGQKSFIRQLNPRQLILVSFYFCGEPTNSSLVRSWGKDKAVLKDELQQMKKDLLIEDSLTPKGQLSFKLRYPKGFNEMDELVLQIPQLDDDEWDIMADTMAEAKKLIKLALKEGFSKSYIKKLYKGLGVEI